MRRLSLVKMTRLSAVTLAAPTSTTFIVWEVHLVLRDLLRWRYMREQCRLFKAGLMILLLLTRRVGHDHARIVVYATVDSVLMDSLCWARVSRDTMPCQTWYLRLDLFKHVRLAVVGEHGLALRLSRWSWDSPQLRSIHRLLLLRAVTSARLLLDLRLLAVELLLIDRGCSSGCSHRDWRGIPPCANHCLRVIVTDGDGKVHLMAGRRIVERMLYCVWIMGLCWVHI